MRSKAEIRILSYEPRHREAFRDLNTWWIRQYFKMEEKDYQILDHPETHIVGKGGHILVAELQGRPVGVCALIPSEVEGFDYELTKMGVSPRFHGRGIGKALGVSILEKARDLGARRVFLDSNTVLGPAIKLYRQLGFREIPTGNSPYERCNIRMAVDL